MSKLDWHRQLCCAVGGSFGVKHFFSPCVHGAERKDGISEHAGQKWEDLEEKHLRDGDQQVSVFGMSGCDRVQHCSDDRFGVLESGPAC